MSLGFVFPGQGSQSVGMLAEIGARYPQIIETFSEADETLQLPLWQLAQEGPEERLNQTEITQPVLLTASVGLWRAWRDERGALPSIMAGHSLGEYSALVCAGAMSFADGVRLVHERGKLMQEAVPQGEGAMAAIIGLTDEIVGGCCASVEGVVTPANYNAPGQVVVAGSAAAVTQAVANCEEAGARRAVMLRVSGPFHCALMEPAKVAFAEILDTVELTMPEIPIVHNVDASRAGDLTDLRQKLLAQLAQPVRWSSCVQEMLNVGVTQLIECGPGKVLAGLVKRIDRSVGVANIESPAVFADALTGA